jgi:hypothetical protein
METTNDNREILPGVDSKYNFKYYKFPNDLTQHHNNHYMVIQINVQTNLGSVQGNFPITGVTGDLSKVDELNWNGGGQFVSPRQAERMGRIGGIGLTNDPRVGTYDPLKMGPTSRGTRRISDAIALFMPTPIIFNTINDYEEIKLTQLFGQGIAALAGAAAARNAGAAGASIQDAQQAGADRTQAVDGLGRVAGAASKMLGYPINPRVEVLFSNTKLRQYVFEFLLAPRSEEESKVISNIIRTLRFHAAPELELFGNFFIPPAEFDITFYHNGKENLAMPRINTCILDRIEVDYTPQQGMYATFSNGYPVTTRLSLGLREVEAIHKTRVYQGF